MGCHSMPKFTVWVFFTEARCYESNDMKPALGMEFCTTDRSLSVVMRKFEELNPEPGNYTLVTESSNNGFPRVMNVKAEPVPTPRVKVSVV